MWNDESFPVRFCVFRILAFYFESNCIRHNIIYDLSFRISDFAFSKSDCADVM